jgi:hypothetical protein
MEGEQIGPPLWAQVLMRNSSAFESFRTYWEAHRTRAMEETVINVVRDDIGGAREKAAEVVAYDTMIRRLEHFLEEEQHGFIQKQSGR